MKLLRKFDSIILMSFSTAFHVAACSHEYCMLPERISVTSVLKLRYFSPCLHPKKLNLSSNKTLRLEPRRRSGEIQRKDFFVIKYPLIFSQSYGIQLGRLVSVRNTSLFNLKYAEKELQAFNGESSNQRKYFTFYANTLLKNVSLTKLLSLALWIKFIPLKGLNRYLGIHVLRYISVCLCKSLMTKWWIFIILASAWIYILKAKLYKPCHGKTRGKLVLQLMCTNKEASYLRDLLCDCH